MFNFIFNFDESLKAINKPIKFRITQVPNLVF